MHHMEKIKLIDNAVVTKDAEGKVVVHETAELTTGEGAFRGALIAGAFGLVFPPGFVLSLIAGASIGALAGRLRDTGIKDADMLAIADCLLPGNAAVVALAEGEWVALIEDSLEGYHGRLITYKLDAFTTSRLNEADTWV
jgi:uncharacterized membrane protein